MHEALRRCWRRWRPGRGWSASPRSSGWCWSARSGSQGHVLEVVMAAVSGGAGGGDDQRSARVRRWRSRGTLLGVYWVGLAFAHVELLRQLPARQRGLPRRPGRHVRGGHRRVRRRPAVRTPPARAQRLAEQDGRGPVLRDARSRSSRCSWPGLYQTWLTQGHALAARAWRWRRWGRSATCSSRWSSATPASRTSGSVFGPHGGALDRARRRAVHGRGRLLRLARASTEA